MERVRGDREINIFSEITMRDGVFLTEEVELRDEVS